MTDDAIPHLLVVDDDRRLRDLLGKYLTDHGFRVSVAASAADARQQMTAIQFDLIVLDRMMPGEDGLTFARSVRGASPVPILMLTAMGDLPDRIGGLEAGADDYLTKPFEPRELVLRIGSILRRSAPPAAPGGAEGEVNLGACRFDLAREILLGERGQIRLTSAETSLLKVLGSEPGTVMSREELTRRCVIDGGERTVDVQVTRLRRKIEPDPKTPRYLQTVRGRGYVLRPD